MSNNFIINHYMQHYGKNNYKYYKQYESDKPKYRLYSNILKSYYINYEYLCVNKKHEDEKIVNGLADNLSNNFKNMIYYNSERICNYYEIFNDFTLYYNNKNDMFDKNSYIAFKKYIGNNLGIKSQLVKSNITISMFYKESYICYKLIKHIINNDYQKYKGNIIMLFSMLEISVKNIYKISKHENGRYFDELLIFIKDKFRKLLINTYYEQNIITKDINRWNYIKYNKKEINKWLKNIPIYYLGSKKKMVNIILGKIEEINNSKNIDRFLELFGGSMCISYVLKKLNPNLDIIVYENNELLINFYRYLMVNYNELIQNIGNVLKNIESNKNRYEYINFIIDSVNKSLTNKVKINPIIMACYYYIINKVSYRGIIKYGPKKEIKVTIDKSKIEKLLKFDNEQKHKLCEFSTFLKNIKIKNIDINNNYNIIYKDITKNTILYLDPPYHTTKKEYSNYQSNFNENNHISLNNFLNNIHKKNIMWIKSNRKTGFILDLYYKYKKTIINLSNKINGSFRPDLLITSF